MTSVESVGSNENVFLALEEEPTIKEAAASISFEIEGKGEGIEKLRFEEVGLQAVVMERHERLERIKNMAQGFSHFSYMKGTPEILEKIAAVDFSAAKEIIDHWEYDFQRDSAYLRLANYVNDNDAKTLLSKVKEGYCDLSVLCKVYQEEKRRGFPEEEETNQLIVKQLDKLSWRTRLDINAFASVAFAYQYQLPNFKPLLADLLRKIRGETYFYSWKIDEYFDEMEEWPKDLLNQVLPAIKDKIRECEIDDQLPIWGQLLRLEAKYPALKEVFEEDIAQVIQQLENTDKECSYELAALIKTLASVAPYHAERFLEYLDPDPSWMMIKPRVNIFIGKTKDPDFDRKGEFFKLKEMIEPYFEIFESEEYFELFRAAYAALGEEARPFLYEALRAYRRVDPITSAAEGGRELSKELKATWNEFWGIPKENVRPDPFKGTVYYDLSRWEFKKLLKVLTPTDFPEKEKVIRAAHLKSEGVYSQYSLGGALLKAEVSLL